MQCMAHHVVDDVTFFCVRELHDDDPHRDNDGAEWSKSEGGFDALAWLKSLYDGDETVAGFDHTDCALSPAPDPRYARYCIACGAPKAHAELLQAREALSATAARSLQGLRERLLREKERQLTTSTTAAENVMEDLIRSEQSIENLRKLALSQERENGRLWENIFHAAHLMGQIAQPRPEELEHVADAITGSCLCGSGASMAVGARAAQMRAAAAAESQKP